MVLGLDWQGLDLGHPTCQSLLPPLQNGGADNSGHSPLRAAGGTSEVTDTKCYPWLVAGGWWTVACQSCCCLCVGVSEPGSEQGCS